MAEVLHQHTGPRHRVIEIGPQHVRDAAPHTQLRDVSLQQHSTPLNPLQPVAGSSTGVRPSSAPVRQCHIASRWRSCSPAPAIAHGRLSLFDRQHTYLGPKVLRDWSRRSVEARPVDPESFLQAGSGAPLSFRTNLAQWLKEHPHNREPPFRPGTAGVALSWESRQQPHTLFRHQYDNGTIDFVTLRNGGLQNRVEWGRRVRAGVHAWGATPVDIPVGKWLPIFLDGIREFEEPYRFLSIRGSEGLMLEAGAGLHTAAAGCVAPLRRALEGREPTTVAVAFELILLALRIDPKVAEVWIYDLWQWAQIMNLFLQRRYKVSMGYNTRQMVSVRQCVTDVLLLLEEYGGQHATALIRRYCRVDPAVTAASQQRRAAQKQGTPGYQAWQPFTLF